MSRHEDSPQPASLGLRACKGGAVAVGVAAGNDVPRVVLSTFLETHAEGERLSLEPYRAAFDMVHAADGGSLVDAAEVVATGRKRQEQLATASLQRIVRQMQGAGYRVVIGALLTNRAGWITDLLGYSLAWQEHVAVAETLAVREAIRHAFGLCELVLVEQDEKSLPATAAQAWGMTQAEIDARLKALGATVGRPWRKEQKLACLSAWLATQTQP